MYTCPIDAYEWDIKLWFTYKCFTACIHRDNFGEELVDTEKAKKEVRTGPHEEMTLGEFIDVRILIHEIALAFLYIHAWCMDMYITVCLCMCGSTEEPHSKIASIIIRYIGNFKHELFITNVLN